MLGPEVLPGWPHVGHPGLGTRFCADFVPGVVERLPGSGPWQAGYLPFQISDWVCQWAVTL